MNTQIYEALVILFLACCVGLFFGDDVVNGGPIVDMSRIDPSVSVVMLIGVLNSTKSSKRLVLRFGMPQLQQYQLDVSIFKCFVNLCVHRHHQKTNPNNRQEIKLPKGVYDC
jgi:hypothetical protein